MEYKLEDLNLSKGYFKWIWKIFKIEVCKDFEKREKHKSLFCKL
jgi:hypothetical protein